MLKALERIKRATNLPSKNFSFNIKSTNTTKPTYALAASKHAPSPAVIAQPAIFRPATIRKAPTTPLLPPNQ